METKHLAATVALMTIVAGGAADAQTLTTHRIPFALAIEAVNEAVSTCANQGYNESAAVVDADGEIIASARGDAAGMHTLGSAHDKAYTAASFKSDTSVLAERASKGDAIAPLGKLPQVLFFGGGIVIKRGNETIGAIGAAGAPGAQYDEGCARAGLAKIADRLK